MNIERAAIGIQREITSTPHSTNTCMHSWLRTLWKQIGEGLFELNHSRELGGSFLETTHQGWWEDWPLALPRKNLQVWGASCGITFLSWSCLGRAPSRIGIPLVVNSGFDGCHVGLKLSQNEAKVMDRPTAVPQVPHSHRTAKLTEPHKAGELVKNGKKLEQPIIFIINDVISTCRQTCFDSWKT